MHILSLHMIRVNMTRFPFLVHTISVYHTMFLHETTLLVYLASVTYDGTPLSWQCDIGLRLEYDF